jgi:hypothetical protein
MTDVVGSRLLTLAPVEVAVAGTPEQVPTSGATWAAKTVILQALSTNEEPVVVGDKTVKAEAGAHGSAKQRGVELPAKATLAVEVNDSTQVWVDARKNKDGVAVTVLLL